MEANYPEIYKAVRVFEGGNDDDPQDPGGRTSRGIIQHPEWDNFRKTHPGRPADVWKATEADIGTIYHDGEYWVGQGLGEFFSGGDEIMFDYGVNSGVGRSRKVLRRCLHLSDTAPRADVDAAISKLSAAQKKILINAICDERLAFLRQLRTFPHFGKGWTARVAQSRAIALHLADFPVVASTPAAQPVPVVPVPQAAPPEASAKAQHAEPTGAKNAVKTAAGGGPVAGGASFWDWVTGHPIESGVIVVCTIVLAVIVIKAINDWQEARKVAPPPGWVPPPELKPAT